MFNQHFSHPKDRSLAIDLFRLIAIMCVVLVHIPYRFSAVPESTGGVLAYMQALLAMPFADQAVVFFKYGLGRVASPALSLVSAWFLLKALEEQHRPFRTIVTTKAQNLLIPYVVWNMVNVALFLCIFYATGRDEYHFAESIPAAVWNSTFNLFDWPYNGPLHYLLDLFEIIVVYALLHRFLYKNKLLLLALTIISPLLSSYFGQSQSWLGDNKLSLLPRVDLMFYFLVGVLTYRSHEQLFSKRAVVWLTHPAVVISLAVLIVLSSKFIYYYTEVLTPEATVLNTVYLYVTLLIRAIASLCVFAVALIAYRAWKLKISRRAVFRIFCSHAPVIWLINAGVNNVLTDDYALTRYLVVFGLALVVGWGISRVIDRLQAYGKIPLLRYI